MDSSDTQEGVFSATPGDPAVVYIALVIFFAILLVNYVSKDEAKKAKRKRNGLIHFRQLPSPFGFPVVGHLTRMGSLPHLALSRWTKKYGPMFRIKMGFQEVLVISGTDNIKRALLKTDAFAGRPDLETSKLISEGLSLTFSDHNKIWERQKAAAKAAVSMYTTGKDPTKRSIMESSAYKHASGLTEELLQIAAENDGVLNPRDPTLIHAASAITSVCFGEDFDNNDPKLREMLSINRDFDRAMAACQPVNFWPILQYFPIISTPFKKLQIFSRIYWDFLTTMLKSHWKTYDDEHMRDLTDCLYYESERQRRNNNEKPIVVPNGVSKHSNHTMTAECNGNGTRYGNGTLNGFGQVSNGSKSYHKANSMPGNILNPECDEDKETERELKKRISYNIGDIFGAGFDTTFSLVHWMFLYMASYPDTQVKMREEIDRVIGPDEAPSYRLHASKCSYTTAWIYEVLRHCSPSPILLPHRTTQRIEFNNCVIPAGVTVYFNAWGAHRDPEKWNNPEEFIPERFLNTEEDGSFSFKKNSTINLFSWGAGKRKCLGYLLSRHMLFIFLCTIIRRLDVQPYQPGVEPTGQWPVNFGLAMKPDPFRIRVKERQF